MPISVANLVYVFILNETRIIEIIGGFHLQNPSEKQLKDTLDYLGKLKPPVVYPCHCTDLKSKIALSKIVQIEEVGVGLKIQFD